MTNSLAALLLANAVPLVGVLFFGWSAAAVLGLYWLETLIVGAFTVLRMMTASRNMGPPRLFMCAFFCVHFGIFMLVHGMLLAVVIGLGAATSFTPESPGEVADHLVRGLMDRGGALIGVGALTVSHGVSFFTNWLGRGEYRDQFVKDVMFTPYRRVIVMHITVLVGGILTMVLGEAFALLVLLVVLKTAVDVRAHRREHRHSFAR